MKTKITIEAGAWKKALATLNTVVMTRSALPILGDVLLRYDAEQKLFQLTASDNESWLTLDCRHDADTPWVHLIEDDMRDRFSAVCLPFTRLKDAVGLLPSGAVLSVWFDGDSHLMTVDYQIGKFSIPFEDAAEYPVCPGVVGPSTPREDGMASPVCRFAIPSAQLLPLMKQARICAANDELRPVMNGECLEVFNDRLVVVATDGHTLFKDVLDLGLGSGWLQYGEFPAFDAETQKQGSARLIVPRTVMAALTTAFAASEQLEITADTERMVFRSQGVVLVTRCLEGKYPNYDSVIPVDSPHRVVVSREALRLALRRLNLFANTASNMAVMRRDGERFVIEASDTELSGSGSEQVSIHEGDAFLPDDFRIGFKISNSLTLLDAIPTENVVLFFSDAGRAFLYKPEDVKSARLLMQMPMIINE